MKKIKLALWFASLFAATISLAQSTYTSLKKIKVFVIATSDKNHSPMVAKAIPMFQKMAADNNFEIHLTRDTAELNPQNLSQYQVFIQLSIAYFDFSRAQQFAIQQFITSGKGWIGIHGAGLTGKQFAAKDGIDWKWYWSLLGDAYYSPHPKLQDGVVNIENRKHPVTKNLPASFSLRDEWYEFENAPKNVQVLAVADENTYKPKKPMGYHPVIWTNPAYHRVLYISVGHDSTSCKSEPYKILLRDAIKWAAEDQGKQQIRDSEASILVDEAGYNGALPKKAMFKSKFPLPSQTRFKIVDAMTLDTTSIYTGKLEPSSKGKDRNDDYWYSPISFSEFAKPGFYKIQVLANKKVYDSFDFRVGK